MANIRIPHLVARASKAAGTSWYWQPSAALAKAGWTSLPLGKGGTPDAPPEAAVDAARAQNRKVEAWRAGGAIPASVRPIAAPLTVAALIARFREEGWPSVERPGTFLRASTRKEYASKLRTIETWAGATPLAAITPERVAVLRDALMQPAKSGPRKGEVRHTMAHATLRVGRTLFTWAEQKRLIPKGSNPFDDFGLATPDPRHQVWSPEAREAVAAAAVEAGEPSMALAIDLAFSIGQREADLLALPVQRYVEIPAYKMDADVYEALAKAAPDGRVKGCRLRQNKGGRWVEVPVVGVTREAVEAGIARALAAGCTTILIDDRIGQPWAGEAGQDRFIKRFAELRAAAIAAALKAGDADLAAELEDLQFRDFRRTAVVYMGELGLADHLIAAITGHSLDETKKILDTYMPRTTGMAARAIALSQLRGSSAAATQGKTG